jgi:superfamily I DNA and/or RNA helicase
VVLLAAKVTNPTFFVFSDDSKWCEENLKNLKNVCFVEKELAHHGADNSDYLQLMKACKHFIISNSTFAWWAAWLSTNINKTVVTPVNWFNDKKIITRDVCPESWIRI